MSQEPPTAADGQIPGQPELAGKTLGRCVGDARRRAKEHRPGRRTMVFVKEFARQVSRDATAKVRAAVVVLTVVVVALICVLAWTIVHDRDTERERERTSQEQQRRIAEAEAGLKLAERNFRAQLAETRRTAEAECERLLDVVAEQLRELEQRNRALAVRFREWHREIRKSVYLLIVSAPVVNNAGDVVTTIVGSGTGWVIDETGHLITNKHVVKPWLFDLAGKLARSRLRVDLAACRWFAFPADATVVFRSVERRFREAKIIVRPDNGYSTEAGTLAVVGTAPDVWANAVTHQHAADTPNDLALLKITAPGVKHVPLTCYDPTTTTWRPEALSMVMAVGYPLGLAALEGQATELSRGVKEYRRVVQTSPTLGEIRKIQTSIQVSSPIIPGNSGGPVIAYDSAKERPVVVGVATAIARGRETQGICIKVEHALRLLESLAPRTQPTGSGADAGSGSGSASGSEQGGPQSQPAGG